MTYVYVNGWRATLAAAMSNTTTTLTPSSTVGLPWTLDPTAVAPLVSTLIIDCDPATGEPTANSEIVTVTDTRTVPWTVVRADEAVAGGVLGGAPVAHASGVPIAFVVSAAALAQIGIPRDASVTPAKLDPATVALFDPVGAASPQPPAFSRIFYAGHSLMAAGGASNPDRGWGEVLAAMLRAESWSVAKGGAVLSWDEHGITGDGGWANVVNNIVFPQRHVNDRGAYVAGSVYYQGDRVISGGNWYVWSGSASTTGVAPPGSSWVQITDQHSPGALKYVPRPDIGVLFFGNNDLGWSNDLNSFKESFRYLLALASGSTLWDDNHPLIAYSGSWSARSAANTNTSYGSGYRVLPAVVGQTVTVTIPPDFPGGAVDFLFVTTPTCSGRIDFTVDGAAAGSKTFALGSSSGGQTPTAGKNSPGVMRLTGLTAGAHTIVGTVGVAPAANSVFFDGVVIEATPAPPVVFVGLFKPPSYTIWSKPIGDADVDAWNTALTALAAAEFPNVIWVDAASALADHQYFYEDSVHPNDLGHATVAATAYTVIRSAPIPIQTAALVSQDTRIVDAGYRVYNTGVFAVPAATADFTLLPVTDTAGTYGFADLFIRAQVGDLLELGVNGLWASSAAAGVIDLAVMDPRPATPVPLSWISTGGAATSGIGITESFTPVSVVAPLLSMPQFYKVRPGDIVTGVATVRLYAGKQGAGVSKTIGKAGTSSQRLLMWFKNHGPMSAQRDPWAL